MEVPAEPGMLGDRTGCRRRNPADNWSQTGCAALRDRPHGSSPTNQRTWWLGPRCRRGDHRAQDETPTALARPEVPGPINRQGRSMNVQIMVDRLAQQCDLENPLLLKTLAFFDNVVRRPMDFRPPSVGHNAVGAELVAAPGDADVGRSAGKASLVRVKGTREVKKFQAIRGRAKSLGSSGGRPLKCGPNALISVLGCVVNQQRQLVQLSRTAHQVHRGESLQRPGPSR